jgi:hypothetical protein
VGLGIRGSRAWGQIVTVFSGRQYSDLPFEGEIPKELDGMVPAACGSAVAVCV